MGFLHLIVPKSRFQLESGEKHLATYRFGTGVARHLFCTRCGIQSFYIPRSNPDGVSVHAGCIDDLEGYTVEPFDGAGDWASHAAKVAQLSKD